MKLLSKAKLCYKVVTILPSRTMLLISVKKFVSLLLLLSLFGQAVASGMMNCKMEQNTQVETHSDCMSNSVNLESTNTQHHDSFLDQGSDALSSECAQDCECCLGACSSSASMPTNIVALNQPSSIVYGYKNRNLINCNESLYRPPIAC